MKLELKHIAGYLPYGLKVYDEESGDIELLTGLNTFSIVNNKPTLNFDPKYINASSFFYIEQYKPILRPMSDLIKPLEDGKIPIVELAKILGDFESIIGINVDESQTDINGNPAPYYEVKYVSNIDEHGDVHATLVFCPDTCSFERMIIYNANLTKSVSANDFRGCPIRCYNQFYEFLYSHHFDIHGLIDKGLASEKKGREK